MSDGQFVKLTIALVRSGEKVELDAEDTTAFIDYVESQQKKIKELELSKRFNDGLENDLFNSDALVMRLTDALKEHCVCDFEIIDGEKVSIGEKCQVCFDISNWVDLDEEKVISSKLTAYRELVEKVTEDIIQHKPFTAIQAIEDFEKENK